MTDPVLRFVTCWTKAVLTRFSSYVSTNLISEDFPVYDLSCVEKSRVEAQFARMRLRLNFIYDDICLRTVVCTKPKKRVLVYMI